MEKTLGALAWDLADAKVNESLACDARIAVEQKIAALVPGPDSGAKTLTLADGRKVTVTRGYNYKADVSAVISLFHDVPHPVPVKVKTTRELDVAGYEWYRKEMPEVFARMSDHVKVTPKKISVVLKEAKT